MRLAPTILCAPYISSMIITGLEAYSSHDKTAAAARYLEAASNVFRETGTIWDLYAPEKIRGHFRPGTSKDGKAISKDDFTRTREMHWFSFIGMEQDNTLQ